MDIDPERLARSPFVIGGAGALIAAFKFLPGASVLAKLGNAASGTAVAGFMAPAVTEWLSMKSEAYLGGAAFILGLLGMSLAAALLKAIGETPLGQIISGWLSRRE